MSGVDRAIPSDNPEFPFLCVDRQALLKEVTAMGMDPKNCTWVPDEKEGYVWGKIESTTGDEVNVIVNNQSKKVKKDDCQDMNPIKYEMTNDMADLTQLNEASILHNLRSRYGHKHIYTYSGLFCVVVNPYKMLPIYTESVVAQYRGKRKTEMPPHLYAVADGAFSFMLQDRENQSILITGESGAGKTENTKKVIQYFARVAAAQAASDGDVPTADEKKKASLEEQIVQCNPPLEAYGNAKTVRNNNSSRFGKFIRIHFGPTGKIAGADIEHYLLEKSRVTSCGRLERNYHIFYQLCTPKGAAQWHEKLLLPSGGVGDFHFANQGVLTVDGIDDDFEMKATDDALDVLGFKQEEKASLFKCVAAIMWMGQMQFKQGKSEQAEPEGTGEAEKAAFLMGVNATDLLKCLTKPKIKVGTEMVEKAQNKDQVIYAVATLSKSLYSRLFDWLVKMCNLTLDTKKARQYFIGVLDIAGFEIFEFNSFEQICINYTNERLQQFFNHHMFVLEQDEYKKEGIEWVFIDFGLDLAACIELIEKPMGIMAMLEEECIVPKGSDTGYVEKMFKQHLGKHPNFLKPSSASLKGKPKDKCPHFELKHYAGSVAYSCAGWLERNKDPINTCTVELMSSSKDQLVPTLFPVDPPDAGGGGKKKKGGAMQTISAAHRESLNRLMKNLYSTHPHFVRCLIPNETKTSWVMDAALVLNQLKCNGVLEGIRICRKGFPNRMIYPDFKQRYPILAPNAVPSGFVDAKVVAEKVLGALNLGEHDYKLGHTKVFFRAGVMGKLEEIREEKLSAILQNFQSFVRGFLNRRQYKKLIDQRTALAMAQRNIRKYMAVKEWKWLKLYFLIKPLLKQIAGEDELKKQQEEFEKTKEELERFENKAKELEGQNVTLLQQNKDMNVNLQLAQDKLDELESTVESFLTLRAELEERAKEAEQLAEGEAGTIHKLEGDRNRLSGEVDNLKGDLETAAGNLQKAEQDKKAKDDQIRKMQEDLANQDNAAAKLTKEKKALDEGLKKTQADLQAEEDKVNHLNKTKQKLETALDEMEDNVNREKKIRADVEKTKRKVENDLKMTQEAVSELERVRQDLEDTMRKKDSDINNLTAKTEEDASLIAQLQKKIKDQQRKIEELEEEHEAERAARVKVEKQRAELQRELEDLSMRLDEAGGATAAQMEVGKRREQELSKMRADMEDQRMQNEQALQSMKKKNQDAVNELTEQVEHANRNRQKVEKEKQQIKAEVDDLHGQLEMITKAKANAEKQGKQMDANCNDLNAKLEEQARQIADVQSQRARAGQEAQEFQRQVEEAEHNLSAMQKQKQQLQAQLDDAKRTAEDEGRQRAKFQAEARNLQNDVDRMREQVEEEQEGKSNVQRQLAKSQQELQQFKARAAAGEFGSGEASDDVKRKFNAKLQEAESQFESAMSKVSTLEKQKHKLQAELEDVTVEAERAQSQASQTEKKQRQMDKVIAEYQAKIDGLSADLEQSHRESRGFSAEVYKLKAHNEEAQDVQDGLRRENKNLSDEIRELMDQLSEGGRSVHEVEKTRRRLEVEKQELQSALEEAEAAIENETIKQQRMQIELSQLHGDVSKRMAEKDEENEMGRKNLQRMNESLQASLEAETRAKQEAVKNKKKLEGDVNELEVALDATNRVRVELEKNSKRFQQQVMELQHRADEESRLRDEAREQLMMSERRTASVHAEVEELRAACDQADRMRKTAESELHEAADRVSELQSQNSHLTSMKRKTDNDIQAISSDLDDAINELKSQEEKAKRAQGEAARLADELRAEQEHGQQIERLRKQLESQVREMQARVDEAEASSMKGGKRQVAKLENRLREIEAEMDNEQRAHQETAKVARRAEARLKEVIFQAEEEAKSRDRMQDMCGQLQNKLKVYKRQVEEAEELAAINLTKYRKVQAEFEEATERADSAEQMAAKMRLQARGASVGRSTSMQR